MVTLRNRRGVALIFVLCVLIVLAGIAVEVGRMARFEANIVVTLRSRTLARYAAESGVTAATAGIETMLDSLPDAPERAASFRRLDARLASLRDAEIGGARFGVAVADLNARIDLNHAEAPMLQAFFRQFTSESRAEIIVASLKAKPLERIGELLAVPGMDDKLALAVAPYVTVWADGVININSAPEPVLAALPGVGVAMAKSIVGQRESGVVFTPAASALTQASVESVGAASPLAEALVTTSPNRLMIIARGWQDGAPLTHEVQAVFAVVGTRLVLQAWQEWDL